MKKSQIRVVAAILILVALLLTLGMTSCDVWRTGGLHVTPTPTQITSPTRPATEPLFDGSSGSLDPAERQELIDRLEYAATRSSPIDQR